MTTHDERLDVAVTFNPTRGYVATAPGLPPVTALSLGGLRRRIEADVALMQEIIRRASRVDKPLIINLL
jgi:hypothetical protein